MKSKFHKKIAVCLFMVLISLTTIACNMDPAELEMLMAIMAGFSGANGMAFNQMADGQGAMGAQLGSQLRNLWMSQSENSQSGRDVTGILQQNLAATQYYSDGGDREDSGFGDFSNLSVASAFDNPSFNMDNF